MSPVPTWMRWSPLAIRDRAAMGSPCEPVDISTILSSGKSSTFFRSTRMPSGTFR